MIPNAEAGSKAFRADELAAWIAGVCGGRPRGVIFDCDGVIIDSAAANIHYYNLLRRELGLPLLTPEQEHYVQMSTAQQAIEAIIPAPLMPALREVTSRISYRRDIVPMLRPSEGIHALLEHCRALGIRMGVHTNRRDGMGDVIANCRFEGFFNPVVTVARALPKPDPDGAFQILREWGLSAHETLFIGDSSTDRDAAAGAGIPFLPYRNPHLDTPGFCADFAELETALDLTGHDPARAGKF